MADLTKAKKVKVVGVVYCLTHGGVHDDTLDPYGEGRNSCFDDMYEKRSKAMVHRTVFAGLRKGDIDEDEVG